MIVSFEVFIKGGLLKGGWARPRRFKHLRSRVFLRFLAADFLARKEGYLAVITFFTRASFDWLLKPSRAPRNLSSKFEIQSFTAIRLASSSAALTSLRLNSEKVPETHDLEEPRSFGLSVHKA